MRHTPHAASIALVLALAGTALGQDSVPSTPGGNDALSPIAAGTQRVRYVVDAVPFTGSWGTRFVLAPISKATRDFDPLFRTQILGSIAASATVARNAGASAAYAVWNTPGQGVHPTANTAPGTLAAGPFPTRFGVALSDFSLSPSTVTGLLVGYAPSFQSRYFVERVVAATSRDTAVDPDTATLSLGGVDSAGNVTLRADNFNTLPSTLTRVSGDSILRVNASSRNGSVINTLAGSGGLNAAADPAASVFLLNNEPTPTNTPAAAFQPGVAPWALVFDFATQFRAGSTISNLATTTAHLAPSVVGHRGNPAYSPISASGAASANPGVGGVIASLALRTGQTRVDTINVFGLTTGAANTPPAPAAGTPRAFTLPASISNPLTAYTANTGNTAAFRQYLSQTGFRGGNGQAAVGRTPQGNLVVAATATETAGAFIAAARSTSPTTETWTVVAHPNQPISSGALPGPVGALETPANLQLSSPAVDRVGNIYFIATYKPTLQPTATGLFRAINAAGGYQLELILSTGQAFVGANSTRPFTITSLTLSDSDSVASGSLFANALVHDAPLGGNTADPASSRSLGAGIVVSAVLTYNNNSVNEPYDAVLLIAPPNRCPGDFNDDAVQQPADIFAFLNAYFSGSAAADFNLDAVLAPADIFAFLSAYFSPCS
jgi:hypothetical protein